MKNGFKLLTVSLSLVCILGCSTSAVEKGKQGTIAYLVQVETSEPGVRIEADNEFVGTAPLTLKIFGDKDGTFHNFGSHEYVIRALPVKTNQFVQTKVFRTGGWFSQEDKIPKRLFFDMEQKTSGFSIDLPPRY
jgi:hypothetical protein